MHLHTENLIKVRLRKAEGPRQSYMQIATKRACIRGRPLSNGGLLRQAV